MLHEKRTWTVALIDTPEELARRLTQYTWTGCSGWKLPNSKLVYLNDSTSGDGAQEYGVVIAETGEQVESVTFGWMTEERALETLRRFERETPSEACGRVEPRRYRHDAHSRTCHLCA